MGYALFSSALWFLILDVCGALVCRAAAEPRLRKWLALLILAQLIPLLNLAAMLLLLILESVMLRKTAQPGAASAV